MQQIQLDRYRELLNKIPRRTNECWIGTIEDSQPQEIYVCGHKFLLRLEGTALEIWRRMDGSLTVSQIVADLADHYTALNPEQICSEVVEYIIGLERLGLAAWRLRPLFEEVILDDMP